MNVTLFDRQRRRAGLAAAAISFAVFGCSAPAKADLRVCNKSRVLVNLAVGANDGEDFATEGWWTVTPGSCTTPIHGALQGRYIYLYATDIDAVDVLETPSNSRSSSLSGSYSSLRRS